MTTRVYLDHASVSPLRPEGFDAMVPFLRDHHADPGRVHSDGRITRVAIENAREQVGAWVGARPSEVIFTAGGTEAVNSAIYGALRRSPDASRIVTTAVEHSAVLEACQREPLDTVVVGVDHHGRVDPARIATALNGQTALVSIQCANHEVGTVQPVAEIAAIVRDHNALLHVHASAAVGHLAVNFANLDADLLSFTGHGCGGPKGVGVLLVRRGLRIPPFLVGGAQERDRRAGLENVPAIVGLGAIAEINTQTLTSECATQSHLTDRLRTGLAEHCTGITLHGDPERRLPNIVCFGVDGVEAEPILLALDQRGIAIHSGSACSSESLEPSPVLAAMGANADHALRVSVGWSSTDTDIERLLAELPAIITTMRTLRTAG